MKKTKIAFLDTVGLAYHGDTLREKGLGGSESAIIFLGQELTKIDFDVTVFNRCDKEGIYDGVQYLNLDKARTTQQFFDVLVVSRTVLPFTPPRLGPEIFSKYHYDTGVYENLVSRSQYKVMWLHDTFILGEEYVEEYLADGFFDEIFTLSDWHTQYIANARHGNIERHFELIKHKNFQTRNGIKSYIKEVDIFKKDPDLFVYNASTTKGLVPLLRQIWPSVQEEFPEAKLTVIGGYYQISDVPDEIEEMYWKLVKENKKNDNITFTGIIKQDEIAKILEKASYFIYPGAFPETFGISATEALNYNVPLITTRFGALEEIAPDDTSYLIEFPITMNMNNYARVESVADKDQISRFLGLVRKARSDSYLRQQKMYACEKYKPFLGWDTVALQWKHHFFYKLGLYLPIQELEEVRFRTGRLYSLYKRRYVNPEDFVEDFSRYPSTNIAIISPVYNAEKYIEKNIISIASQNYDNYTHYIIDDLSTDSTYSIAEQTIAQLPENIRSKFILIKNNEKRYALGNQIYVLKNISDDSIVALLDGDDWLTNNPDIFNLINREYALGAKFTYGSCHSLADNIDLVAQPYPEEVKEARAYRKHLFNWGVPYTHLRTFSRSLFNYVDDSLLRDETGCYFKAAGDAALFYALIEQCSPSEVHPIQEIIMQYNDRNPLNDYKANKETQDRAVNIIRQQRSAYSPFSSIIDGAALEQMRGGNAPEIVSELKNSLLERDRTWLDDLSSHYIKPRLTWLKNTFSFYQKESKILDVGSWTGGIANELYEGGFKDITCFDISKKVVGAGKETFPHLKWLCGDAENYIFEEKYDIIIMLEILEHLEKPLAAIAKFQNMLLPGGKIIFTIPTEKHVFDQGANEHISRIKKEELLDAGASVSLIKTEEGDYEWYCGFIEESNKAVCESKTKILIALPTAKNIETDTFLSLYRLKKPENSDVYLECFFGYNVDQIRNLIADFGIRNKFDYVLFVDSDIVIPEDTLLRLLSFKKDIITGVYIQRRPGQKVTEIYPLGGGKNITDPTFFSQGELIEIGGCGFGCVLVSTKVLKAVGYPQFYYHDSIDFKDTISEDIDFCIKAKNHGFKIYVVSDLLYEHISFVKLKF